MTYVQTNLRLPKFLREVSLTQMERAYYEDLTSNWLKTHRILHTLSEDDLKKILVLELQSRCRPHFIGRIKQRINRLRNEREDVELLTTRARHIELDNDESETREEA